MPSTESTDRVGQPLNEYTPGTSPAGETREFSGTPDIRKEVRFAIVLYGGVSLAVYIGGVARELLAMVRATAVMHDEQGAEQFVEPKASESMAVYRRLAARLNAPRDRAKDSDLVYTRFIIDVISGTSAGGLNGVYLAKALARGQTIDHLRGLWLKVGDIAELLNRQPRPSAVLDGDVMLKELREAFVAMEGMGVGTGNPFVDDIECYATTTDLHGLPVAISLADSQIVELGHKVVFRFASSSNGASDGAKSAGGDFANNDDALAFASRCTSAFPGAFAPVKLADAKGIQDPAKLFPAYVGTSNNSHGAGNGSVFDAARHAFSDGGILNNKPFSHAIGALRSRGSGKPSERKLLYVEPSPDVAFDMDKARQSPSGDFSSPTFFNVVSTSNSLPGQQTIREDLELVTERNRTIDRVSALLADIPDEVLRYQAQTKKALLARQQAAAAAGNQQELELVARLIAIVDQSDWQKSATAFANNDVGEMMEIFGLGYGGYHRLKVASVTDDLATALSRVLGYANRSAEFWGVRSLVRAWRDLAFAPYLRNPPSSEQQRVRGILDAVADFPQSVARVNSRVSENTFLLDWDIEYRIRRLDFLLNKADDLFCLDDRGAMFLRAFGVSDVSSWVSDARRDALRTITENVAKVHAALRRQADALANPLSEIGKQIIAVTQAAGFPRSQLLTLSSGSDAKRDNLEYRLVAQSFEAFQAIAETYRRAINDAGRAASAEMARLLPVDPNKPDWTKDPNALEPVDVLRFFYDNFEFVDRISFPVFYQSTVGQELDTVSVIRVSPTDAVSIVPAPAPGETRRRLGGETLDHFGGFFAKEWRASDFLWGQLDGAERIITAACEGATTVSDAERIDFIKQAHLAILANDANVQGIALLERINGADCAARRYATMKNQYLEIVKNPPELPQALTTTAKSALEIVGNIVRGEQAGDGASRPKPNLGMRAAGAAIYVAQSAFGNSGDGPNDVLDAKARRMVMVANVLILGGVCAIAAGIWLLYVRCLPACLVVGSMRILGGIGAIAGGTIAAAIGVALNWVRRWIPESLKKLIPT
jgi:patatin-related protein